MEQLPISITTRNALTCMADHPYTLWMVLQGEVSCIVDAREFRLSRSDVLFLSPEQEFLTIPEQARTAEKKELIVLCLSIDDSFLLSQFHPDQARISCNSVLEPGNYTILRQRISELALSTTAGGQELWLHSMALCYELLDCLLGFCTALPQLPELQRKQEIERYLRKHYREPLSLNKLAETFYLSPQYLSRYIKKTFHRGFLTLLTEIRLDGAVRELQEGRSSITQAALNHGFPNVSSFNTAFRQTYDTSPRAYLKTLKKTEAEQTTAQDVTVLARQLEEFLPRTEAEATTHELIKKAEIDSTVLQEYRTGWQTLINLEQAAYLLDNAYQSHVIQVQERLHFTYGRIIDVFSPKVFPGIAERGLKNFTHLNRIIDFLLSVKLKPFIELQPKPVKKAISPDMLKVEEAGSISENDWAQYLHAFFSYLCKRWGEEEVETWRFELWLPHNETLEIPSIELRRYVRRFRTTREIMRDYIPSGVLGGPGLNLGGSSLQALEELLQLMREQDISPDFYSAYLFPAYVGKRSGDTVTFSRIIGGDVEDWPELLRAFRETIDEPEKAIFVTEFSTDVTSRSWLNDTGYKAAVLVRSFMQLGEMVDGMGYWNLSDLSYDAVESNILLFGGNGMISRNGIPKSVYHAFTFLARQGKTLVALGEYHMVTRRNHRHYEVLVHNCKPLSEYYRQELFAQRAAPVSGSVFSDTRPLRLMLRLKDMRPGNYTVQKYAIEQHYGDLAEAVRAFGCPSVMRDEEKDYLLHTSVPKQSMEIVPCDGSLSMDILLHANEVALYTLVYDD